MYWDKGTQEPALDVAEESESPRRPMPRWLRTSAIAVVVAGAGWLGFLRVTDPGVTVRTEPPRFDDNYGVELVVTVTNAGDDPLEIVPTAPRTDGMVFTGTRTMGEAEPTDTRDPFALAPRGRTSFALDWRVEDCVQARAGRDDDARLDLRIGPSIGPKEVLHVSAGRWGDFIPDVCRTRSDLGIPRVSGQEVNPQWDSVFVKVTVQNVGGRGLVFRTGDLPAGWTHLNNYSATPLSQRQIPVGDRRVILLHFEAADCHAPEQGPAEVTLRFDSVGSSTPQALRLRLADSWQNLLGVCTSESFGDSQP